MNDATPEAAALAAVVAAALDRYKPTFKNHTPFPDGALRANEPADNNINKILGLVAKDHLDIQAAINGVDDLVASHTNSIGSLNGRVNVLETGPKRMGIAVTTALTNGAQIPWPGGFEKWETRFFAFIKSYSQSSASSPAQFQVYTSVTEGIMQIYPDQGEIAGTGVAVAQRGGW